MKKYVMQICIVASVCLLGMVAFCGYHIYDHYAYEAEQTEAFEQIAEVVEQAGSAVRRVAESCSAVSDIPAKTIKAKRQAEKTIKQTARSTGKTIKSTAKGTVKSVEKSVKTA